MKKSYSNTYTKIKQRISNIEKQLSDAVKYFNDVQSKPANQGYDKTRLMDIILGDIQKLKSELNAEYELLESVPVYQNCDEMNLKYNFKNEEDFHTIYRNKMEQVNEILMIQEKNNNN